MLKDKLDRKFMVSRTEKNGCRLVKSCILVNLILLTALIMSNATSAASVIYYLRNNATVQSVGVDGDTNYSATGTTITVVPYKNLLQKNTGARNAIDYTTASTAEVEVFRFYLISNYSSDTLISANTTGYIRWRATSNTNIVNVSLIDYNPANGAKTLIGNRSFTTTGGTTITTYQGTINHSAYTVQAGNRLMFRINTTTPTPGTVRLAFNDWISNITVIETALSNKTLKVYTSRYSVFAPWAFKPSASGLSTDFIAYALLMGADGKPAFGENITFKIYSPAGLKATKYDITKSNGIANISYDVINDIGQSVDPDYGSWNVTAYLTNDTMLQEITYMKIEEGGYVLGGGMEGCTYPYCHNSGTQDRGGYTRSPYTENYNQTSTRAEAAHTKSGGMGGGHVGKGCYYCHPGYSPNNKTGSYGSTSDVHDATCDYCHGNWTYISGTGAGQGKGIPKMPSCYDCHPLFNNNMTNISTLANLAAGDNISVYSYNYDRKAPLTGHNDTNYSYNQSVPCIVCHGPVHNTTKPDESQQFIKNTVTENTQCTTCHGNLQHSQSNPVYCTACHSQDAHTIQMLGKDGTYKNRQSSGAITSNKSDCTACHNSGSPDNFFGYLTSMNPLAYSINFDPVGKYNVQHPMANCTNSCHNTANFHNISKAAGGPDCLICHDSNGSANHRVDGNAIATGMHANLNPKTPADPNSKCWGCHDSNGTKPQNSMGDLYNTPYKCIDCHTSSGQKPGGYGAFIVDEHYPSGIDIKAISGISNLGACILCHNKTVMKVNYISPDNIDTNYSLVSHYGKNRTDIHTVNETNCSYCHQNISEFNDVFQKISNTQITHNFGKSCYLCHRTEGSIDGRIHDSSLVGGGGNDCIACHSPKDVNISKFGRHANINTSDGNGIVTNADCWTCHYQKDMNRSNVYLCESCHKNSSGIVKVNDSALIKSDFMHGSTSCKTCHAPIGSGYHLKGTVGPLGLVESILSLRQIS